MRIALLSLSLFVLTGGLGDVQAVWAQRDTSCDDGLELSPACPFTFAVDPDATGPGASSTPSPYCEEPEILALRAGCYLCVDPNGCAERYDEGPPNNAVAQPEGYEEDAPGDGTPIEERLEQDPKYEDDTQDTDSRVKGYEQEPQVVEPQVDGDDQDPQDDAEPAGNDDDQDPEGVAPPTEEDTVIEDNEEEMRHKARHAFHPIRNDHAGKHGIHIQAHHAAVEAAVETHLKPRSAIQGGPHWSILAPVFVALVSIGIAVRGRLKRPRSEFVRVVESDDAEEINPFCADRECNPQQDDEELEYGKQHGDYDGSDDEYYRRR